MRNLKKVLALVLALVMCLSLVTIANAADFSDDADISYDEAVDVMVAAGIIDGVGNNSFDPNGTLTREQAAKLITYMLLGENSDKLGVESSSFKDVAVTRWSAPAIEYCVTMGIIDGAGDGNFYPAGRLTGFAFAKMLLTALGYKSDREGFTGSNWTINVATKALSEDVRLDKGLEKMFGSAELSRQEAAQMALNAIQAPIVEYDGNSVEVNGTTINIGNTGARFVTTTIANQQSISTRRLTNSNSANDKSGFTVELGEKYLPKLERRGQLDDFGRPAYTWSYDKKEIGTYLDDSDLVATFTAKVTGKDLYDAITKANLDDAKDNFTVYIDGEYDADINDLVFPKSKVSRSNDDGEGGTEKGVLTQVFVQKDFDNDETNIIISIINTYLAIASEDYDSKNEDVNLDVYALNKTDAHTSRNPDYIKDRDNTDPFGVTVKNEDIDVTEVKEDDKYLVTIAQGKVQTMAVPEIVSDASIDSFKLHKDVTVEGKTYEYAHTAKYDVDVLDDYSQTNLKDTTYNVVLDEYGYLIGIEQNEEADLYVFLTGLDGNYSYLTNKDSDANVIFMDGRMETVTVNMKKSSPSVKVDATTGEPSSTGTVYGNVEGGDWEDTDSNGSDDRNYSQINTWCTYSVDNKGVYTLKEVGPAFPTKGTKVAQSVQNASAEVKIDNKNVSLEDAEGGKVYGNNDSVYINVSLEAVKTKEDTNPWYKVVDDVESVTTGVRNTGLKITDLGTAASTAGSEKAKAILPVNEIYTLYKDNGYIIAAVVIGEDDGLNKTYAYITSDDVKRERYDKTADEWTWVREAVVDGKLVDLTEVGGGTDLSELEDMVQNNWYEIKTDANGNVTDKKLINTVDTSGPTGSHTAANNTAANAKDYVFCKDTDHFDTGNPVTADYPKFIGKSEMVDDAVNDNDTVILFQKGFTAPVNEESEEEKTVTYKNGTLYVGVADNKGFDVSPDVKTVLCLSDGEGNPFDDVDDSYTGYAGLERAIKNFDSNFTGDLSVVFDKGSAVVIIFNDVTGSDDAENNGDVTGDLELGFMGCAFGSQNIQLVVHDGEGGYLTLNELIALGIEADDVTITMRGKKVDTKVGDNETGTYFDGSTSKTWKFTVDPIAYFKVDQYQSNGGISGSNGFVEESGYMKIHLAEQLKYGELKVTIRLSGKTLTGTYTVGS